jgi:hypothetical protein
MCLPKTFSTSESEFHEMACGEKRRVKTVAALMQMVSLFRIIRLRFLSFKQHNELTVSRLRKHIDRSRNFRNKRLTPHFLCGFLAQVHKVLDNLLR